MKKSGYELIHIGVGSQYRDYISNEGIRLIEIARKRYFANPFIDKLFRLFSFRPSIYKKIFDQARRLRADVYHFHDLQINRIGPKLKSLSHHPKIINDVHEPYPEIARFLNNAYGISRLFYYLYSLYIDKWQIRCAQKYDLIIATEENVAQYFQKAVKPDKVRIIYNYSNFPLTRNSEKEKIYDAIYTGGISGWRGIFELLNTAKLAKEKNISIKILCIGNIKGDGLKQKIQKFITENDLDDYFELKNFVAHEMITSYYEKSRIGLCIFRDNPVYRILMPIKIFEYMALGLPVLCNNFGHPGKIIRKEKCGITLENIEPNYILNAAIEILTNPKLYSEMSENGKSAVKSTYNWENAEKELIHIYKDLLS